MLKPPVSEKAQCEIVNYLTENMSVDEKLTFEKRCQNSPELNLQLNEMKGVISTLNDWNTQQSPNYLNNISFQKRQKASFMQWLSLGVAMAALVLSLLPQIHFTPQGLLIGGQQNYVTKSELEQSVEEINWHQDELLDDKIGQYKVEQNSQSQQLVLKLIQHYETQRKQDLKQMVSWMSEQKELNSQQQRQIVQWVRNEQRQDSTQLKALWTQVANRNQEDIHQ